MPFTLSHPLPVIIQGGMGVGISSWQLARAVVLRAMREFPLPSLAERVLARYHRPEGRGERPYLPPSLG